MSEQTKDGGQDLHALQQEQTAEGFVRMLLWDEFPECCGSPVVGAEYMGQQEMICCGNPEPTLLSDTQIVTALRERFPEGILESKSDALHLARSRLLEFAERIDELKLAVKLLCQNFPTDIDMDAAGWVTHEINSACDAYDFARSVLNKENGNGPATAEAEFEVHCNGDYEASAIGPRAQAWVEIQRYVAQYRQDGPVVVYEVTRTPVAIAHQSPKENDRA